MVALALFHAALAALCVAAVVLRADHRDAFAGLTWKDVAGYIAVGPASAAISLLFFDAIGAHQFRAHEEAYHLAFLGRVPLGGWTPMETQPLLRAVHQAAGGVFGQGMAVFVAVALLTGTWSASLLGAGSQMLSGRRWVGFATAGIAALHPFATYWRPHAFHVAAPHVLWAGTFLLAVVVARKPTRLAATAWLLVGGLAVTLRQDQLFGVMATAAIPLVLTGGDLWRRPRIWGPAMLVATALLVAAIVPDMRAGVEREDFHFGLRFLTLHLSVLDAYRPLTYLPMLPLLALGFWAASRPREALRNTSVPPDLRRAARALRWITLAALLPDLLFMDFGPRHLLNTTDAGTALALVGVAAALHVIRTENRDGPRKKVFAAVALTLVVGVAFLSVVDIADLGSRYGDGTQVVPELPGVTRPTGPLEPAEEDCGVFAGEAAICDQWQFCWPLKDLRDPDNVGRFWDEHDGCVLFMVDISLDDTAGAVHEWWRMVRSIYTWDPVGILDVPGGSNRTVEVYRLRNRPRKSSAQRVKDDDHRREDGQ
jgi:hypothetical protein